MGVLTNFGSDYSHQETVLQLCFSFSFGGLDGRSQGFAEDKLVCVSSCGCWQTLGMTALYKFMRDQETVL